MANDLLPPEDEAELERYIDAISAGQEPSAAAKVTGVTEKVMLAHVSRPRAVGLMKARRQARIEGDVANLAVETLRALMISAPPAVRLGAAKAALAMAGHGEGTSEADKPKDLNEMTPTQLRAFVEMAGERLADLAKPVGQGNAD